MLLLAEVDGMFSKDSLGTALAGSGFKELSRLKFGLYQIGGLEEPTPPWSRFRECNWIWYMSSGNVRAFIWATRDGLGRPRVANPPSLFSLTNQSL